MARQPRLIVEGYPHHIILRGNNKSAIFSDDQDRRFFIDCLKEAKEKTKSKIYAYCLMTNHVHLIIEPSVKEGISKMIQSLGRKYVQYINYKYDRTGTLWEGRFKSSIISKDGYLLACSKYIELNPVRAKIVEDPEKYNWSSFKFKTAGKADVLLEEDPAYCELGESSEERQLNYKKWFYGSILQEEPDLIRTAAQKCGIVGNKDFIDEISKLLGRNIVLRPVGRPKNSKWGQSEFFEKNSL